MKRSVLSASGVALVLVVSVFAHGADAAKRSEPFQFEQFLQHRGGVVNGRALALALGDVQLSIGENQGSLSQSVNSLTNISEMLDDSVAFDCASDTAARKRAIQLKDTSKGLTFDGSVPCLDRQLGQALVDSLQRGVSIDLGLARAEQVQVGAVQHQDRGHYRLPLDARGRTRPGRA